MSAPSPPPPTRPTTPAEPIAAADRLEIVDVLRGFALFGILLVNMPFFKAPGGPPGLTFEGSALDYLVALAIQAFAQAKFFTLFSFLFGFGFSIQLLRAQRCGGPFVPRFLRRLLVLLLFGLAHAFLLWYGDILVLYALPGAVLILFRNRSPRARLIWASAILIVQALLFGAGAVATELGRATPEGGAEIRQAEAELVADFREQRAEDLQVYGRGTYREILAERAEDLGEVYIFLLLQGPPTFAMFLLGLYAGQRGVLDRVDEHLSLLRRVRLWGLGLGLPLNLLVVAAATQLGPLTALLLLGLNLALGGPILSMGYAATLVLLARRAGWQRRLAPLAATGRIALTNYLSQSLICTTIFYGYGLGLFGQVGAAGGLLLSTAIYALQIPFSIWWLRHFRFGPIEWLWRSLTYLRPQPMRRPAETTA
jgi:uncharacterized protein